MAHLHGNRAGEIKGTRERTNSLPVIGARKAGEEREEMKKRKREEGMHIAEIFKRSNKLLRSPTGEKPKEKEEVEKVEEGREGGKEVERMLGILLNEMKEMRKEMIGGREEVRAEIKKIEEKMIEREKAWVAREKQLETRIEKMEKRLEEMGKKEGRQSRNSEDNLSEKEIGKIKKWMLEQEREERKCNIVIKGVRERIGGWKGKEWAQSFLKERLGITCKVVDNRISGPVIVVKVENEKKKREIKLNKNKLKGTAFYIENDLSWEERKIQEKINKWAREQRGKGEEIKVGVGRVRVKGVGRKWEEIEGTEEKGGGCVGSRERRGGTNRENKGESEIEQNFR